MQWYLSQVKHFQSSFEVLSIEQVPRSKNAHANSLATLATSLGEGLPRVIMVEDLVEDLVASSLDNRVLIRVNAMHVSLSQIDLVVSFLKDETLLEDKTDAKKTQRKAPWYWLFEEQKIYKRSYSGPYLLCVHLEIVEALLEELHKGICGSHTRGRSLSHKALTQGYWWPSMQMFAQEFVKKCNQ